ncbi:ATP-binding protein [Robbsia sp. KACC 23696]|uniref:PAS domain-containing sensor histidine kinase n=1 Tax=Robbsia sp. KACC 23696 TaxID=3149231 RepID=UPI00325ADFBA
MRFSFFAEQQWPPPPASSRVLIGAAAVIAVIIFCIDALTTLDIAISVLYVIVISLVALTGNRLLTLYAGLLCIVLTIVGYVVPHSAFYDPEATARSIVGLTAIGTSLFLSLQGLSGTEMLIEKMRLLELSHDAIIVHGLDGRISSWNRGAQALYGISESDAKGKSMHALLTTTGTTRLDTLHMALLETGQWEGQLIQYRADGRRVIVTSRCVLFRDGYGRPLSIIATNNDITARVDAEQRLARSEAFHAEAQYLSHTGSVAIQFPYRKIACSVEASRILGAPDRDVLTMEMLYSVIHPADRRRLISDYLALHEGASMVDTECRLCMADGTEKHIRIVAHRLTGNPDSLLDTGDDRVGAYVSEYVGALMDVTESRRTQEALHRSLQDLNHVARLSTLGELAASIAHEVSQPIAAVVTHGDAALRWLRRATPDHAETGQAIENMIRDAKRASDVVQRVRAMAQKRDRDVQTLDMNALIRESLALLQQDVNAQAVRLSVDLLGDLPPVVADRIHIQQVVVNLLLNAIQALKGVAPHGRYLRVTTRTDAARRVVISIDDRGSGLTAESANHLFTPFFSTKSDGLGIGLVIARSIIESYGGDIGITAREGGGASAVFSLPSHDARH